MLKLSVKCIYSLCKYITHCDWLLRSLWEALNSRKAPWPRQTNICSLTLMLSLSLLKSRSPLRAGASPPEPEGMCSGVWDRGSSSSTQLQPWARGTNPSSLKFYQLQQQQPALMCRGAAAFSECKQEKCQPIPVLANHTPPVNNESLTYLIIELCFVL